MAWNSIQQFKSIKNQKQRIVQFCKIIETYLLEKSPLELNVARNKIGVSEIIEIYQVIKKSIQETNSVAKNRKGIHADVFDKIQVACENNMLDSFYRFHTVFRKDLDEFLRKKQQSINDKV